MIFRRKPCQVDSWAPIPPWVSDAAIVVLLSFEALVLCSTDWDWGWGFGVAITPSILFVGTRTIWRHRYISLAAKREHQQWKD